MRNCCLIEKNRKFNGCESDGDPIYQCNACGSIFCGRELARLDKEYGLDKGNI